MGHIQNVLVFAALCVLALTLAQAPQGGPHTNQGGSPTQQGGPHQTQGRSRREVKEEGDDDSFDISQVYPVNWTTCDYTCEKKISCFDCNTRLICKRIGGLLLTCSNPFKPYCNNGICSPIPSVKCAAA